MALIAALLKKSAGMIHKSLCNPIPLSLSALFNDLCLLHWFSMSNFCFNLYCSHNAYCAERFENAVCDSICNNEACLKDGLDCETGSPKLVRDIDFDCL